MVVNLKSEVDENTGIFRALPGEGCADFACRRTDCFSHRALRERRCEGREDRK